MCVGWEKFEHLYLSSPLLYFEENQNIQALTTQRMKNIQDGIAQKL